MKLQVASGRLNYQPTFGYTDGVLIGPNWYEERQKYINTTHSHKTWYSTDYVDKGILSVDPSEFWNVKIPGEGFDPRLVMDHEGTKYHENYATSSDLVYSYLPKRKQIRKYNTMAHTFMPEEDLCLNYGNVTQWGLKEKKRKQWETENNSAACNWNTESTDNYQEPKLEDYVAKRMGKLKSCSSKYYTLNNDYQHMFLRNKQMLILPDIPYELIPRLYPHFYF